MPSPLKQTHTHTFGGGMSSDLAPELMSPDQYRYMLNCNVLSSSEGNIGIVTNILGNTMISVDLPEGVNKTIGVALDEEKNYFYYAVWNSFGYHTWYRYSSVSNTVDRVIQCITDTSDTDIFEWPDRTLILQANVVRNELLYWTMEGQPPRKINILKAMDKSDDGYGASILEEYTRAYKRTAAASPQAEYFTDINKKFNRLYGHQFKFAVRFHYDDGEKSEVSDHSVVPNPDEEYFTGTKGVPERNNGIRVTVETGSRIVKSIEILMQKTNPEGGSLPWVSVVTLEKEFNDIASNSNYTYSFYNDGAYVSVDPKYPIRNNSSLPRLPKCQEFTKNSLMYANSPEGRGQVDIDVEWVVNYQEVFVGSGQADEMNEPSFIFNRTGEGYRQSGGLFGGAAWRWVDGTFIIGPDVKSGNRFHVRAVSTKGGGREIMQFTVTATLTDRAETIANKLASQMRASENFGPLNPVGGFVGEVRRDSFGNAVFDVRITNNAGWMYWEVSTDVNPVNVARLKDTGQSVRIIKNGSSAKYGFVYRDEDGRKELVQANDSLIIPIMTMNELGGIMKPTISLIIKHFPPVWAKEYSIVRTKDLVYANYIQMLIQSVVSTETGSGDKYDDLIVGSLFTYQQLHPNAILRYEFKKGDRVRLMYSYNEDDLRFDVEENVKDFEVIEYREITEDNVNSEVTVDGTATVLTNVASSDNIGNYIRMGNYERLITGADDGVSYSLNSDFPVEGGGSDFKYPGFTIINRRGVLRIKHDEDFPISDLSIVEVYTPATGDLTVSEDQFYEFSKRFDIINWGTDEAYHAGSVQDQSATQDAVIEISEGSSYVRNREMPTNNDSDNPQVLVGLIEDANYSDFYVSDMTDDGKVNVLDQGFGEVNLSESVWWSNNFIEGTRINGLNDFDASNRVDYNDKYGSIQLILFSEDRLYVFKHLKTAWAPVYGRRVTTQDNQTQITASPDILPNMLTYFLWDGGVGDNPESVTRNGNNIVLVSPDSGIMARIGGAGVEPISKTYSLDRDTRNMLMSAKRADSFVISWFDRKNDNWEFSFESHDNVVFDSGFSYSGWAVGEEIPPGNISVSISVLPAHGSVSVNGDVIDYTPNEGYAGSDNFQYNLFANGTLIGTRNVCLTVVFVPGPSAWRPINPECLTSGGSNTGYQGWRDLEQYDTSTGVATGVTKPNSPSDVDHVPPVYNTSACAVGTAITISNEDTDINDPYHLFVDVDAIIEVNGNHVDTILSTETRQYSFPVGSIVRIRQATGAVPNPWPDQSVAVMTVVKDSSTIYSHSETDQNAPLGDYTFTSDAGLYTIQSIGTSTAGGLRKYKFDSRINIPGVNDILGLGYVITDITDLSEVGRKGAVADNVSEFNVIDDSGNCRIKVSNNSGSSYTVTLTNSLGTFTYTQNVGNGFEHTFPNVPKGDYIAIVQ